MENAPSTADILEDFNEISNFEAASRGQRFANLLLDYVGFYAAVFVSGFLIAVIFEITGESFLWQEEDVNPLIDRIFTMLVYVVYYTLLEYFSRGRSLGKLITRTRVVHVDGAELTFKHYLLRSLTRLVPFDAIAGLNGYPFHDRWTKTKVVQLR